MLVHCHIAPEVSGRREESLDHRSDEGFFVRLLEGIVHTLLVAKAVHGFLHHVFSTGRTRTMTGVDHDVVREWEDLFVKTVIEQPRKFFLSEVGCLLCQVGTTHISQKEGVATEESCLTTFFIDEEKA